MEWTTAWLGGVYEPLGRSPRRYDCLGLFLAVQRDQFGRLLDYGLTRCANDEVTARETYFADGGEWTRALQAREGDALLFRRGRGWHIGVALDDSLMLHCDQGKGVVIEPFRAALWGKRLDGVHAWVGAHD